MALSSTATEIEKSVTKHIIEGLAHTFGHLKRVARGAKWFVSILGGSEEEQELAYIGGLLHDIVRPSTEKIDHSSLAAEEAQKILDNTPLQENQIDRILRAIKDHRQPVEWEDTLHQSVYLADKVLEQTGAFAVFRICLYVGECEDFAGTPLEQAVQEYFEDRFARLSLERFPRFVHALIEYRQKRPIEFYDAFVDAESWAMGLSRHCYNASRNGIKVEDCIENFSPINEESKVFQEEAENYLAGEELPLFERMMGESR